MSSGNLEQQGDTQTGCPSGNVEQQPNTKIGSPSGKVEQQPGSQSGTPEASVANKADNSEGMEKQPDTQTGSPEANATNKADNSEQQSESAAQNGETNGHTMEATGNTDDDAYSDDYEHDTNQNTNGSEKPGVIETSPASTNGPSSGTPTGKEQGTRSPKKSSSGLHAKKTMNPISFLASQTEEIQKIFKQLNTNAEHGHANERDVYFDELAPKIDAFGKKHGYTSLSEYIPRADLFRKDDDGRLKINWLEFQGAIRNAEEYSKSHETESDEESIDMNISSDKGAYRRPRAKPRKEEESEGSTDGVGGQLQSVESAHKLAANAVSSKEPLRLSSLLKKKQKLFDVLFKFYANSRNHSNLSRATFDNIANYSSHITRAEFLRCCLDFHLIPLLVRREVAVSTFQDVASLSRGSHISYKEFPHLLAEIMVMAMNNIVASTQREISLLKDGRPCLPALIPDTCLGAIIESVSNGVKVKTVMRGLDFYQLHRVQRTLHDLTTGSASNMTLAVADEDGRFYYVKSPGASEQTVQAEENMRRRALQRKMLEALMEEVGVSKDDLTSFEIDVLYGKKDEGDSYSSLPGSADMEANARRIIESEDTDELLTSIIHKQREDRRQKQTMKRKKQFEDLRSEVWQNASYKGEAARKSSLKQVTSRKGSTSSGSQVSPGYKTSANKGSSFKHSGRETENGLSYNEEDLPASLKEGSPGKRASQRSAERAKEVMNNSRSNSGFGR